MFENGAEKLKKPTEVEPVERENEKSSDPPRAAACDHEHRGDHTEIRTPQILVPQPFPGFAGGLEIDAYKIRKSGTQHHGIPDRLSGTEFRPIKRGAAMTKMAIRRWRC